MASPLVSETVDPAENFRLHLTRITSGDFTGQLFLSGTVDGVLQPSIPLVGCGPNSSCQLSSEVFVEVPRDSFIGVSVVAAFTTSSDGADGAAEKMRLSAATDPAVPAQELSFSTPAGTFDLCSTSASYACSEAFATERCTPSVDGWSICFTFQSTPFPPVQRILFVPWCWSSFVQQDFDDAVERYASFFTSHSALDQCDQPDDIQGRRIELLRGPAECGSTATSYDELLTRLPAGLTREQLDAVVFVEHKPFSQPAPPGTLHDEECIAGLALGGGFIQVQTSAPTPYAGEYIVFAHEYGHTFLDLGEEYREPFSPDEEKWPNRVSAQYGCEPASCCTGLHECSNIGPLLLNGHLCAGNAALNLEGFAWGNPAPTPWGDAGCIMANASATGWDSGDPTTGEGSHRSWCQPCWAVWEQKGARCTGVFDGPKSRLDATIALHPDLFLTMTSAHVGPGRVGPRNATSGSVVITVRDLMGNELGRMAPTRAGADPRGMSDTILAWMRVPVADNVALPLTLAVLENGVERSRVTAGGAVPTAVLENVTAECTAHRSATVILDGTASRDPDGDTLRFAWTSPVPLDDPSAAHPRGRFPLGPTTVSLMVSDGAGAGDAVAAQVTIRDTIPPEMTSSPDAGTTACTAAGVVLTLTAPAVVDQCDDELSLSARIVASTNSALSLPIKVVEGKVALPVGTHVVEWTASDSSGNVSTQQQTVEVVPAIFATRSLEVRPGARLLAGTGFATAASSGTMPSLVQNEAELGDLLSVPSVDLRNRARIHGDVLTAGSVLLGNRVFVSGSILQRQALVLPAPAVPNLTFTPSAMGDISLEPNGLAWVTPGSFDTVRLKPGATLMLAPGTYSINRLVLEPKSTIVATGPLLVFVAAELVQKGALTGFESSSIIYGGTAPVTIEATTVVGRLFAGSTHLVIRARLRAAQLVARDLTVDPGRTFECDPSLLGL